MLVTYTSTKSLRTIFYNIKPILLGNLFYSNEVGGQTKKIDCNYSFCFQCTFVRHCFDSLLKAIYVYVEGPRVYINEYRCGSFKGNNFGAGKEREVWHKDSIAFTYA